MYRETFCGRISQLHLTIELSYVAEDAFENIVSQILKSSAAAVMSRGGQEHTKVLSQSHSITRIRSRGASRHCDPTSVWNVQLCEDSLLEGIRLRLGRNEMRRRWKEKITRSFGG